MATLSTVFYVLAGVIGLILLATHGSSMLVIGIVGFVVSLGYTAPPLKFVYRGLGEIAVALGFGPLMLLGAYVVQTGGALAWEPLVASIPVALLVAWSTWNEILATATATPGGKPTSRCVLGDDRDHFVENVAVIAAYVVLVAGVVLGILPVPVLLMLLTIPLALKVWRGLTRAQLREPLRPHGDHGHKRPAPPAGRPAPPRGIPHRAHRRRSCASGGFLLALSANSRAGPSSGSPPAAS